MVKSEIVLEEPVPEYPCLKVVDDDTINTGMVVLFREPQKGTVVSVPIKCNHTVGYYSPLWLESDFEPFEGELRLCNVNG